MVIRHQPMAFISKPEPEVLVLQGEIDLHESPLIRERVKRILSKRPQRVLVDFSEVSYIDSSGLATLIEAMQRMNSYGGHLGIYGIRDNVMSIFHIARLDQVFRIFPDRAAATESLE